MGPSHMVSMGFVEAVDHYEGVVSQCDSLPSGWFLVVTVARPGGWSDNYAFHDQPEPWPVGSPAVVSVTTGADGKVSQSVARV